MSTEVSIPTTGDVAIWEMQRGVPSRTRTVVDSSEARRVLGKMSTAGVAERGGVVLAAAPRTTRAQMETLRRAVAAHQRGEAAAAPTAPPPPSVEPPKPTAGPKRVLRREALTELCDGCGEAAPNHLTVCPRASSTPPRVEITPAPTPVVASLPTIEAPMSKTDPSETTTRCGAHQCTDAPAAIGKRTAPELEGFCARHRQHAYERAGRWGVALAIAARTVAEGTTARSPEAPPSRRGQRTAKAVAKKAAKPTPKTLPARSMTDTTDTLTVEMRKLLDGVVTETRVREIVAEVVPTMVRDALVAALRSARQ